MKTMAERLDEILQKCWKQAFNLGKFHEYVNPPKAFKLAIVDLFMDCVAVEDPIYMTELVGREATLYDRGFKSCRTETIRNMEKMRGE